MQIRRWNILPADTIKVNTLYDTLRINKTLCTILVQRGLDSFLKTKDYFRPQLNYLHSPWAMKDMDKAVHRILTAISNNEKILIYGDYDVDGTTSVAVMFDFLQKHHKNISFYIPNRFREGYGISKAGVDFAFENNFSLIISLDCGIKSVELIQYAQSLSIDFIVCDHHTPDLELPPAIAILNPKQTDCKYPYKELCGCGVGFKLIQALAERKQLPNDSYLQYLDILAIAIAADIVPITGENRILAFYGLEKINNNPRPGVKALLQLAKHEKDISISSLVFLVAPRVNAAGRMDDAKKAVQLFLEKDLEGALTIANLLHNDNTERREADSNTTQEALAMLEQSLSLPSKKSTVVYSPNWHKGVVGIVASRLIESYYRPTVVLTQSGDYVAGSARSVNGFNVYNAIHACSEYLLGYGGHFAAAGLTLLPENIENFKNKFEEVVAATIHQDSLCPTLTIDAEITFKEINLAFYKILSQMEPFGPENMRPVFIARQVQDSGISKVLKEQHIRFELSQNGTTLSGIGFNMADKFHLLESSSPIDIVFTVELNEWNNQKKLQLKVIDFRQSQLV